MPIVRTGETEYDKELAKWEKPYRYEPFPRMLYKAVKRETGKVLCMEPAPSPFGWARAEDYGRACEMAEAFTRSCQRIVRDEAEERRALSEGWRHSPQEALAAFEQQEQAIGDAAAEVAYAVQRMSANARAEHAAAEEATHEHVTDVVPPPTRSYRKRSHHKRPAPMPPDPASPGG